MLFRPLATPSGAGRRYLGLLAATLGDCDAALDELEQAQRLHGRMGARLWLTVTAVDQAEVHLRRGATGDTDCAEQFLRGARRHARAMGMAGLVARIENLVPRRPVPTPFRDVRTIQR